MFPAKFQRERTQKLVAKKWGFVFTVPRNYVFFTMVNRRCSSSDPNTALSID